MRKPIPFGKYYLLERISVGGMAEVFKAKAFGIEGFEKILAVKRILPTMAEDEDFIAMFIDEAKICGQLSHPNVCQIYELGCIDDTHFIAMEYIHGKDVLQIQNRFRKMRQAMPPQMAAYVASKVCEGLDYAHRKKSANSESLNIIHRDVSPQNVLVSYEGECKVIDFGIAKAANRSNKTQAGILKGKFGYMSPEQVRGLPLDRRSDVFAVGTVLYEMLTAERLFVGESDFSTLEKVRNVDVQLPSALNPKIPKAIEEITMRALSKSVDDRYQWANDMADDLNRFLMSQEPMYSAKRLSHWMKTTFADDLARDTKKMEFYRGIKQQDMAAGVALPEDAVSGQVPVPAVGGQVPAVYSSGPVSTGPGVGLGAPGGGMGAAAVGLATPGPHPTQVFTSDLAQEIDDGDMVEAEEVEEVGAQATMLLDPAAAGGDPQVHGENTMLFDADAHGGDGNGEVHGQKTQLFDAAMHGEDDDGQVHGQKTQLFDANMHGGAEGGDGGGQVHGQKTMLFDPSTMQPPGNGGAGAPMQAAGPGVPMVYAGAYGLQPVPYGVIDPATGSVRMHDGVVRMLPVRRKSTLARDIVIAMVVGFVAVAGVIAFLTFTGRTGLSLGEGGGDEGEDVEGIDDGEGGGSEATGGGGGKGARIVTGLEIETTPSTSDAEVFVNGERRCVETPCKVTELEPGDAKIRILANGYERFDDVVNVTKDELTPFTAKLKVVPKGRGKLKVEVSKRDAAVTINGEPYDPKRGFVELLSGTDHTVKVKLRKWATYEERVVLEADKEKIVKVDLVPAKLTIRVDSSPVKGEVIVDDENRGLGPRDVAGLDIGRPHTLVVKADGYETYRTKISYDGEDVVTVEAKLVAAGEKPTGLKKDPLAGKPKGGDKTKTAAPTGTSAAPDTAKVVYGFLVVNSRPFAKVVVDGKDTGKETPIVPPGLKLTVGKHTVTFRLADGREFNFPVDVKADELNRLVKNLE